MKNVEMKVAKFNFAGAELDVVIGHPKHELLFVASQVAKAAGLDVKVVQNARRKEGSNGLIYMDLMRQAAQFERVGLRLNDVRGQKLRGDAWLFDEPTVYQMLLRGHAPQSEPFRKWVTKEVLPSIRKTGQYDLAKSNTPEAKQVADDFAVLRALASLEAKVDSLQAIIEELKAQGPAVVAEALSS